MPLEVRALWMVTSALGRELDRLRPGQIALRLETKRTGIANVESGVRTREEGTGLQWELVGEAETDGPDAQTGVLTSVYAVERKPRLSACTAGASPSFGESLIQALEHICCSETRASIDEIGHRFRGGAVGVSAVRIINRVVNGGLASLNDSEFAAVQV